MVLARPRAILFDFGNTLLHEGPTDFLAGAGAVLALAREAPGCTADVLANAMSDLMADLDPRRFAAQIELPPETVWRLIYDPLGLAFDHEPATIEWAFWSAATSWTPEPGIEPVLRLLDAHHLKCAVLSNTMFRSHIIARQLATSGLGPFHFVMASSEEILRKPHARLFRRAVQRIGENARDVWFVGDSLEYDMKGAAESGLVPIWYRGQAVVRGVQYGARAVTTWDEFGTLLADTLRAT